LNNNIKTGAKPLAEAVGKSIYAIQSGGFYLDHVVGQHISIYLQTMSESIDLQRPAYEHYTKEPLKWVERTEDEKYALGGSYG